MAKTVAALMGSLERAQEAVRELVASGMRREDIGFMANEKHVPPGETPAQGDAAHDGGIVVTVAATGDAQADQAIDILKRHGAVDIDERVTEWKKQGWKGRFEAGSN